MLVMILQDARRAPMTFLKATESRFLSSTDNSIPDTATFFMASTISGKGKTHFNIIVVNINHKDVFASRKNSTTNIPSKPIMDFKPFSIHICDPSKTKSQYCLKMVNFLITLSDIRKLNTLVTQQRKTGIFHRLSVIYFKSECFLGILNI